MRSAQFCSVIRTDGLASSDAVAALMNNLRIWLDHGSIAPADFVPVRLANGQLAFDIYFRQKEQAILCEATFGVREIDASAALPVAA